jgi:hypothetical protein
VSHAVLPQDPVKKHLASGWSEAAREHLAVVEYGGMEKARRGVNLRHGLFLRRHTTRR